jgi:NitT/TauT family transport system ATP-binding protein
MMAPHSNTPARSTKVFRNAMQQASSETVLEIRGVTHQFRHASREKYATSVSALQNVSLTARKGEFVSLVGPSGCGKSTLLSILAGLTIPSQGAAFIGGDQVTGIRTDVGFIFQRDAILPWRTALQNIELPLKYRNVPAKEAREKALEWLGRMGLRASADRYPHQLSGGMRKRISIAATLVYEPSILLMDEPFSALDVQTRDLIENDVMRVWQGSGQTVVFVTHDLEEAIGMSDRIVVMTASPGRVRQEYEVSLPRPRDLMECKAQPEFRSIYESIWEDLRVEVLKAAQMAQ